jgi:serine/threonine protein kinase|tara:strand:- start:776 stop:1018 length:243 start_codon:yes stop_codon:yes gene_type:complete
MVEEIERELTVLSTLRHKNIIALRGVVLGECLGVSVPKFLCMEMCEGGSLDARIYGESGSGAPPKVSSLEQHARVRRCPR